ncbi:hypothetical protein RRG08_047451 [Elysia crispata]|uniref:Uncharacterized protein n=1 Tax=Elysia crispata TaxID=231223 RepID=A0AAE1D582_9GAST|nr:hypothetical protein RRG08_047451 [Elysia crispata]
MVLGSRQAYSRVDPAGASISKAATSRLRVSSSACYAGQYLNNVDVVTSPITIGRIVREGRPGSDVSESIPTCFASIGAIVEGVSSPIVFPQSPLFPTIHAQGLEKQGTQSSSCNKGQQSASFLATMGK